MGTASVHEGARGMRFESLLGRQERGEITQVEAAEMLGVSVRTLQRWAGRFEEAGADGLADRRLGRPSPRRAPAEELERMLPKELRLAGITTIEAANAWLKDHYMAKHNRQFAIAPEAEPSRISRSSTVRVVLLCWSMRRRRLSILLSALLRKGGYYREWTSYIERVRTKKGRPSKKNVSNSDNFRFLKISRSPTCLERILPKLKSKFPDVFERVCDHLISPHEGAKEAGLVSAPRHTRRLRFGVIDLDGVTNLPVAAQGKLICKIFDQIAVDAQCALIQRRIDRVFGQNVAAQWRSRTIQTVSKQVV
jgi:hypothetical protein